MAIDTQERVAGLEADNASTADRLAPIEGKINSNFRWTIGLMVVLHGITISAIFAAAALFN